MHHTQGTADWGLYQLIEFGAGPKDTYFFHIDRSKLCPEALEYLKYSDVDRIGTTGGIPQHVPDSFYDLINVLHTHPNSDRLGRKAIFTGLCALGEIPLTSKELYTSITELNNATKNSLQYKPITGQILIIVPEIKHLLHALKHSEVVMDLITVYTLGSDNSGKPLTEEHGGLLEVLSYLLLQFSTSTSNDHPPAGYREVVLRYLDQLFSGYTCFSLNLALNISAKMGNFFHLSVPFEQLLELVASDVRTFYQVNRTYSVDELKKYVKHRAGI